MTKMFLAPDGKRMKTWNVFTGCGYRCVYCWAMRMIEKGRLKNSPKYHDGFKPHWHPQEMRKRFTKDDFVFISSLGDISFATPEQIKEIVEYIRHSPATFLFQSKNPGCFHEIIRWCEPPENIYFGTTMETNRETVVAGCLSGAPCEYARFEQIWTLPWKNKFISIEPIMNFDVGGILGWIAQIKPQIVEVGADNYACGLDEPPWEKVEALLKGLKEFVPHVIEKEGLERLKK